MRGSRERARWLSLILASAVLALSACASGGSDEDTGAADPQAEPACALTLAVPPWVGAEASAAVVGEVAESELGCVVDYRALTETAAWRGLSTGEVDVIIEDWGNERFQRRYLAPRGDGSATDFGPNGNVGVVGWYVPPWLAEQEPDVLAWENLNDHAAEFATGATGQRGQLLGIDPSYVQFDEALVENLGLDFQVVFTSDETETVTAFREAEEKQEWLLGYFYEPHWLHAAVPLSRVSLPDHEPGCQSPPRRADCDYPETELRKIVATAWSQSGEPAVGLVRAFQWSNEDQNAVARMIAEDGLSAQDAAARWIEENPDLVAAWVS